MGNILYFPPRIEHHNLLLEGEERMQLLSLTMRKLRLPSAAARLMTYYAAQGHNFRPSLAQIEKKTGIKTNHISEVRNILIKYGLIEYSNRVVIIDWYIIFLFSNMNIKLMGPKKDWQIMPDRKTTAYQLKKLEEQEVKQSHLSSADKYLMRLYEATFEALKEGVEFPELEAAEYVLPELLTANGNDCDPQLFLEEEKWYDPFDRPDPPWVRQEPLDIAVGGNIIYVHFNTQLPF